MSRYSTLATINHDIVVPNLRKVFKREWDLAYPSMPWNNDDASLNNFLGFEKNKNKKKAKETLNNTGDCNKWDSTGVSHALLFSNSIGQKLKNTQRYTAIYQLRCIRNALSHPSPSTYMSETDFTTHYNKIKRCLEDLGLLDAVKDMEDIKQQQTQQFYANHKLNKIYQMTVFLVILFIGVLVVATAVFSPMSDSSHNNISSKQFPPKSEHEHLNIAALQKYGHKIHLNHSAFFFPEFMQPHYFIGCEEVAVQILVNILREKKHLISIVGPSGVGKTTMAMEIAKYLQVQNRYDLVFTNLHNTESMSLALESIMTSLGCQHLMTQTTESIHLSEKVVMILDNIDFALETYESELKDFIERIIRVHRIVVLTTSRNKWNDVNSNFEIYLLQPLSQNSSMKFLNALHPEITPEQACFIANITKGLPFLLQIIGHHLHHKVYSAEYLTQNSFVSNMYANDTCDWNDTACFFPLMEVLCFALNTYLVRQNVNSIFAMTENQIPLKTIPSNIWKEFDEFVKEKYFSSYTNFHQVVPFELSKVLLLSLLLILMGWLLVQKGKLHMINQQVKRIYIFTGILVAYLIQENF